MTKLKRDILIGLLLLVVAIVSPFVIESRYTVGQVTLFFIWATVVSQWNLVFGVGGIFSLAQMALFALGGYAVGMMGLYWGWNLWFALPVGGLFAILFSLVIGAACLRLKGPYVALLTLAISQMMYLLIVTDTACYMQVGATCTNFTGGTRGLANYGDFGFRQLLGYRYMILGDYFLALTVLAAATLFSLLLLHGPLGAAFRAIRDNPGYASARGISRFKFQMLVFASSSFFTGVSGGVFAGYYKVIGPNILDMSLMLFLIAMMVVGGLGRTWGPIVGVAALMLADEFLKDYPDYRAIGLGVVLVLFVMIWPRGLVGGFEAVGRWLLSRWLSVRARRLSES